MKKFAAASVLTGLLVLGSLTGAEAASWHIVLPPVPVPVPVVTAPPPAAPAVQAHYGGYGQGFRARMSRAGFSDGYSDGYNRYRHSYRRHNRFYASAYDRGWEEGRNRRIEDGRRYDNDRGRGRHDRGDGHCKD